MVYEIIPTYLGRISSPTNKTRNFNQVFLLLTMLVGWFLFFSITCGVHPFTESTKNLKKVTPNGKGETSGPKHQLFWGSKCELIRGCMDSLDSYLPRSRNMDPNVMSFEPQPLTYHVCTIMRGIPQNHHTFAWFDPPKWAITTVCFNFARNFTAYKFRPFSFHLSVQIVLLLMCQSKPFYDFFWFFLGGDCG